MVVGYIGLLLILKFMTISWLFDFVPSQTMFRKQLETTLSVGILSVVILLYPAAGQWGWYLVITPILLVGVALLAELLFSYTFECLLSRIQHQFLGMSDFVFDQLPDTMKHDIYTLLMVFYNLIYGLVIVAAFIYWPK